MTKNKTSKYPILLGVFFVIPFNVCFASDDGDSKKEWNAMRTTPSSASSMGPHTDSDEVTSLPLTDKQLPENDEIQNKRKARIERMLKAQDAAQKTYYGKNPDYK